MTACGQKSQPPEAVVEPTPAPTPVAVTPLPATPTQPAPAPTPIPAPPAAALPIPVQTPAPKPTPVKEAAIPIISALPKSPYPDPAPVKIPAIAEPKKIAANPKPDPISRLKIPASPSLQITPVGIGSAKIGMSLKELKEQMGQGFKFPIKPGFIEGFDAIAVTKAGAVQYYIPYPAGTQFTDADKIQHLMTDNPNYRTEQGVGPGTSIQQATTVYGGATLSLSKENESREFINFTQHPNGLAFRPKPAGKDNFAGDYPESNEEYLKTQKYHDKAAIGQITVSCVENQCEQSN